MAGALLFALASFVAVISVTSLLGYSEPKPTVPGTAILVAAAVVMPWLAKEKQRLSGATGSAALRAGASSGQTRLQLSRFCRSLFGRVGKPCAGRLAAVARFAQRSAG
jgi:divalent metal cation (Fe/Co/Zn/Cd) transporter